MGSPGGNLSKFFEQNEQVGQADEPMQPVVVPAHKMPSYMKMFVDRMKFEGRGQEWKEAVKAALEKQKADGKPRHLWSAQHEAKRNMGYPGPQKERELYLQRQGEFHLSSEQKEKRAVKAVKAAVKAVKTFEQAVAALKENAADQVELDWIRAHPAMARAARDPDKKHVTISVDDIQNAPSRSAVWALQHWVNHTTKFYESVMSEQKKREDGGGSHGDFDRDMPLNEAKRILSLIGKRNGGTDQEETGQRRSEPGVGNSREVGVLSGNQFQNPLPDTQE